MFDTARGDDGPEGDVFRREMRALIEQAASQLPVKYRVVFMMRDVEELSTAETARCLNLTEKNVKVRLHRARALLRRELYAAAGPAFKNVFAFDGARCDRIVEAVLADLGCKQFVNHS